MGLVTALEQHSIRVDRTPADLAGLARQAAWDIDEGVATDDTDRVIAGLRRLIGVGGLAKATADRLEAGQ